ncbi:uncharacterized protein N0V89_006614 [Didymosphaeria variabile]|uniref:SGNH hydrolase-type esterase domain-containing protein n=1 Tax=Didymosphaeria variabile TaxID=1932322 RepID=A0A9W8XJW8_9PLEO|nr:uncharacterized protein N0V89_006614 [Didymosphaeria variabile]KAJ4351275.1 hypothetical protein N0V89_006614 [Didymosphaeria variabile]
MPCGIRNKPNLILINAGTNDAIQGDDRGGADYVAAAADRMKSMVDDIWSLGDPDAVIILSTLLPQSDSHHNDYANTINTGLRSLVQTKQAAGQHIQLAEMSPINNNGGATFYMEVGDLTDGIHPRHDTYPKMAAIWTAAINRVIEKGWIKDPVDNEGSNAGGVCIPAQSDFRGPIQTQRGSGADDGTYTHSSTQWSTSNHESWVGDDSILKQFHYAQLTNPGNADRGAELDELIRVLDPDQRGDGLPYEIDVKSQCLNRGVRWGDINNDGLDDFICLNLEGNMYASINKGGNPPTFEYIGQIYTGMDWAPQERIRLGDIDGDGRLDYCAINDIGDIYCWRNGGSGDAPEYWQGMVGGAPTFEHKGMPGIEGVHLLDINGDFKADWVYLFEDGSTRIFINQRGSKDDGGKLKPYWIEATNGARGFPDDPDMNQDHAKFGRITGGDPGHQDYVHVVETSAVANGKTTWSYTFDVFKNTGSGGTKVKGDGVHYCDMFGRGHDDYLWVWSYGGVELFENTQNPPAWTTHGEIINVNRDRKSLHFGDWDGDGLCDILAVDKHTGNVDMWKNTWTSGQASPTFEYRAGIVTGSKCTEGWGVGTFDLGLRFADIDGDGRVDYLCMEEDGRTYGYLNTVNGLTYSKQFKFSEGFDRANHRFADVNGDGKADFLWVDKFTGEVRLWLNGGPQDTGGSTFFWDKQPTPWLAANDFPADRGANIYFAKMGATGRADVIRNMPRTDIAWTWFNECDGGGNVGNGPDDGAPSDPRLPAYSDGLDNGGSGGGGTDPGDGSTIGLTLLTIEAASTIVHMPLDASSLAYDVLTSSTCPATKRADDFTVACLVSTATSLLRDVNMVSTLTELYRGNPIPGTLADLTNVPKYTLETINSAFVDGLPAAANFLKADETDLSITELIWLYYTIMDTAARYLNLHATDYTAFSTARVGNMELTCPPVEDVPCEHTLCVGGDDAVCTGFLKNCACDRQRCTVQYSETEWWPFCGMTTCAPVDSNGLCMAEGKYNKCPCAGDAFTEQLTWYSASDLSQIWLGPNAGGSGPDTRVCYKKGDDTHTPRTNDRNNWKFMEQSVLDTNIDTFCNDFGSINGGGEGGSVTTFNSGSMNEAVLSLEYAEGTTLSVDECKANFKQLSADCDYSSVANQFNWKWGGEFFHEGVTYIIDPRFTRVPVRHDPDTDWWRVGDGTHSWNNGRTVAEGDPRLGANGQPLDMVILIQCIHHLAFLDWNNGAPQDCANGLVDLSGSGTVVYNSWSTCWQQTWQMLAWQFLEEDALCGYSNHQGGAAGPSGAHCWMGVNCWDGV